MEFPTRWCSQCKVDWPQHTQFNLCPKCGRNTTAETSKVKPDETASRALAAKYRAFNEYVAERAGQAVVQTPEIMAGLERAFQVTPSLPDAPKPSGRLAPGKFQGKPFPDDDMPDGA